MHSKNIHITGIPLKDADKALIMLHGRGANVRDILGLAQYLNVADFALIAPQATNNTWYPYSFLAPPQQNEPCLSSALGLLKEVVNDLSEQRFATKSIYFLGFSQGACLVLEFVARNAARYGGIVGFTGGLIGDKIYKGNYHGDFKGTPIFIGTSNPDMHVPVERVHETTAILKGMNAIVTEKVYDNMGHTISEDEIEVADRLVFSKEKFKG
jgi:phospholipase/carboxylesterase